MATAKRVRVGLVAALVAASGLAAVAVQPATAAEPTISITSPSNFSTVDGTRFSVEGSFSASPTDGVNAVYVTDVSGSTASPTGQDCNGDGRADALDNFNNAGATGDTLDCEISGVIALNASIRNASRVQVALIPFGSSASAANLGGAGVEKVFIPPAEDVDNDRSGTADVVQAAGSMTQGQIALFSPRSVSTGTNFDAAITEPLRVKGLAPFSRTVAFFLSDGESSVSSSTLSSLTASGIEVSTYAIGAGTGCQTNGPLDQIAKATSRTCTTVTNPASLQGVLGGGQPSDLDRIEVSTGGTTQRASVDALGNWTAEFTNIAPGSKSITATAFLRDGTQKSAVVVVTVAGGGRTYVALGDSFSAGHGNPPFLGKSSFDGICQRSTRGYSQLVRFPGAATPIVDDLFSDGPLMRNETCTGAVIANYDATPQHPGISLHVNALGPQVDLVTLTMGGNDGGFVDILKHCATQFDCQNDGFARLSSGRELRLKEWLDVRLRLLQNELVQLYRDVKNETNGNARVIVLDYPRFFRQGTFLTCKDAVAFGPKERDFLSDTIVKFGASIKSSANQAGVDFVEVIDSFRGHEICSGDPWMLDGSKLLQDRPGGPPVFHPNIKGMAEYARLINEHLKTVPAVVGAQAQSSGATPAPGQAKQGTIVAQSLAAQPIAVAEPAPLTEAEMAEVRSLELADTFLASIAALKDPDAQCTSSAVPSQQLALAGSGFTPGTPVHVTFKAANEETRRSYPDLIAKPDGTVSSWVVVPTDASANPNDPETTTAGSERAVGSGFQLEGTSQTGNQRRLLGSFYLEAADSTCGRFARDTGQLSTDGKLAPGTGGSGFDAPLSTTPQGGIRGGVGIVAGSIDRDGNRIPDTAMVIRAQASQGGKSVQGAFILAGPGMQFFGSSVLSSAFSSDGSKTSLVMTGEGTVGIGGNDRRIFRAEVTTAGRGLFGIAFNPTVDICIYKVGQSCGDEDPGVVHFAGPLTGIARLSPAPR